MRRDDKRGRMLYIVQRRSSPPAPVLPPPQTLASPVLVRRQYFSSEKPPGAGGSSSASASSMETIVPAASGGCCCHSNLPYYEPNHYCVCVIVKREEDEVGDSGCGSSSSSSSASLASSEPDDNSKKDRKRWWKLPSLKRRGANLRKSNRPQKYIDAGEEEEEDGDDEDGEVEEHVEDVCEEEDEDICAGIREVSPVLDLYGDEGQREEEVLILDRNLEEQDDDGDLSEEFCCRRPRGCNTFDSIGRSPSHNNVDHNNSSRQSSLNKAGSLSSSPSTCSSSQQQKQHNRPSQRLSNLIERTSSLTRDGLSRNSSWMSSAGANNNNSDVNDCKNYQDCCWLSEENEDEEEEAEVEQEDEEEEKKHYLEVSCRRVRKDFYIVFGLVVLLIKMTMMNVLSLCVCSTPNRFCMHHLGSSSSYSSLVAECFDCSSKIHSPSVVLFPPPTSRGLIGLTRE